MSSSTEGEVAGIIRLVVVRVASGFYFLAKPLDQFPLELQQSPSVIVDIHGCLQHAANESGSNIRFFTFVQW